MIVSTALDATRSWSGIVNRFATGFLTIWVIAKYSDGSLEISDFMGEEISPTLFSVFQVVAIVMASMLVGAIAILVGALSFWKRYREPSRTWRAFYVGKTGNPLLIDSLRDAQMKMDLVQGLTGAILLSGGAISLFALNQLLFGAVAGEASSSASLNIWQYIAIAVLSGIVRELVMRSATQSLDAIDEILEDFLRQTGVSKLEKNEQ